MRRNFPPWGILSVSISFTDEGKQRNTLAQRKIIPERCYRKATPRNISYKNTIQEHRDEWKKKNKIALPCAGEREDNMEYKFTVDNFETEVLQSDIPVLVDFYAD